MNNFDVNSIVENFILKNRNGIATLLKSNNNSDSLYINSQIAELSEELKSGCISLINNNKSLSDLDKYFYGIAVNFKKKSNTSNIKNKTEYLCPACLYLGNSVIISNNKIFSCNECSEKLSSSLDDKTKALLNMFYLHNKAGYACNDCNRFIPHPLDTTKIVSCPYFDCCFVGDISILRKKHHPSKQSNCEKLIGLSYQDINANAIDPLSNLEIKDELSLKVKIIKEVIESQKNTILYNSSESTIKHKEYVYIAFMNLLNKYPVDMINYLLEDSRTGGFQHKIFQEYISLLEDSLPIHFKKNGSIIKIDSLLDPHLGLFDGISIFIGTVNNGIIKNNTSEYYIGGRKASYSCPFYIGKLLSLSLNEKDIMNNVIEYTFNKIKVKDIPNGSNVKVSHLRVPPHYQMGGMVHVNRIRKKIVDKALLILKSNSL